MPVNAISWVAKETKRLQRADKNRKPYKSYNEKAWAAWRKKPKSKRVGSVAYKGDVRGKTTNPKTPPEEQPRTGTKGKGYGSSVSGLHRVAGRKTSVTYNVPVRESGRFGSVSSHQGAIAKILKDKLGSEYAKAMTATTKTVKRKHLKEVARIKADLRKYTK